VGILNEKEDSPRPRCDCRRGAGLSTKVETQEAPQTKEGKAMSDAWITLSNLFDNLRGYLKHHYGTASTMKVKVEFDREVDGRWIADVIDFPGVMAYGETQEEALENVMRVLTAVQAQ